MYCNVCNLFPPTLVTVHHTRDNIGAYQWPHLSTIVPQIYHAPAHKQHSWVTFACHVISADDSVQFPELSNLIEQTAATHIPQCWSNHGWREVFLHLSDLTKHSQHQLTVETLPSGLNLWSSVVTLYQKSWLQYDTCLNISTPILKS